MASCSSGARPAEAPQPSRGDSPALRLVSVQVGRPEPLVHGDETVVSAIVKRPVEGPVEVAAGLAGDAQADPTAHGGEDKAVYAYPSEHYPWWRARAPLDEIPHGAFGENLTTEGLREGALRLGDLLRVGTAVLEVAQPRMPCRKLAIRWGWPRVVAELVASGRCGAYLAVHEPGVLAAGDAIELLARDATRPTIAQVASWAYGHDEGPLEGAAIERALAWPRLGREWRTRLQRRLG